MTKKILDFAQRANDFVTAHKHSSIAKDSQEWINVFNNRFAELLVRDCYEFCKTQLIDDLELAREQGLTYNDGVADCAIGLLKYFELPGSEDITDIE